MIDHSNKEAFMKKTSLMLAIGALLYGASGSYALANIYPGMSDANILEIINQMGDIPPSTEPEIAEDDYGGDIPDGLDPPTPPSFPSNVHVDSSHPVHLSKMCNPSFTVNGAAMAEFPVIVDGEEGTWTTVGGKTAVVGTGWMLVLPSGDTWNTSSWWRLYTEVPITQILLKPLDRNTSLDPKGAKKAYVFDIGGLLPRAPAPAPDPLATLEHTIGSARGRVIKQVSPSLPPPIFTATYRDPVYIPDVNHLNGSSDGNYIPPASSPTHDLYGTLEINFDSTVGDLLIDPGFAFIADTDCVLPVNQVNLDSYKDGILKFTVVGEGAVAIMDNAQKLVQGPFMVERGQGQATFTTQFIPTAGSCYAMMDVDTLKVMTQNYCF